MNLTFRRSACAGGQKKLAAAALSNRLYVNGWSLQPVLLDIVDGMTVGESLVVAFSNGEPVGVCLILNQRDRQPMTMTFVKRKYRRLGIGTQLFRRAFGSTNAEFRYGQGTKETEKFFDRFPGARKTRSW